MSEGTAKKFMFVNRSAPYGTIYALESLEVVLISAAFDQDVSLAFVEDGVWQLRKGQQTKGIETKNFSPTYRALEGYDVEKLYVERESLEARGLSEDDLIVDVTVLSSGELGRLMDEQDRLRAAKLEQLRDDVREGIASGVSQPWSASKAKSEARARRARKAA